MDWQHIISLIGIPSTVLAFVYIGRKLQVLDILVKDIEDLKKRISSLESYVNSLEKKFTTLWTRFEMFTHKVVGLSSRVDSIANKFENFSLEFNNLIPKTNRLCIGCDQSVSGINVFGHLARANSPKKLSDAGLDILHRSKIGDIVSQNKSYIIKYLKSKNPTNAYDAQIFIFEAVQNIVLENPLISRDLKNIAYKLGLNINEILYVGALYIKDEIFEDINFQI